MALSSRNWLTTMQTTMIAAVCVSISIATFVSAITPTRVAAQQSTHELELAEKYAPIVYMKEQPGECSADGEQYLPAPVESVLGDPEVELKQIASAGTPSDPVIMTGPTAVDLAGLDETYYINMPFNSRAPGCDYEEWFKAKVEQQGIPLVVYARVATEPEAPGRLALQYWFYWVFNQFNNLHESDWEMAQLNFDADSAEEALTTNPTDVAFAQHGGGEHADWDDTKLEREGNRIVVFPASGSHATYYPDSLWIGWGQNGSGFGCDDIRKPLVRAEPAIVLMPNTIDSEGDFAWLLFDGRWGEKQGWEFNGPKGPNGGEKWAHPVTWTDDIRNDSLAVPGDARIGNGPTGFFCSFASLGGSIMAVTNVNPTYVAAISTVALLFIMVIAFFGWRYLVSAILLYFRNLHIFLPISLLLIVVALVGRLIERGIDRIPLVRDALNAAESSSILASALGFGFGSIQQLLLFSIVAPAVIHATFELVSRGTVSPRQSVQIARKAFPSVIGAILWNTALIFVLIITIVGIPIAIYKAVQWLYTPQAVIVQGAASRQARLVSASIVKGHWIRTLGMGLLIAAVSGLPGPVLGLVTFILLGLSMNVADVVSSATYAVTYPIAVIAATSYYLTIGGYNRSLAQTRVPRESSDAATPRTAPA